MRMVWLMGTLACAMCMNALAGDLADVQRRGALTVGVYKEFPPFFDGGQGIDVDMAQALAKKLGVRAELQAYDAGDNMDDDLRIMVWKGSPTALGLPPADVMLHVPIDAVFMERNPRVRIFSPYYRETLAVLRSTEALPALDSMMSAEGKAIGAEADSITDMALLAYDGGRLGGTVKHYLHIDAVPSDLRSGAIAAFFGLRSQVEPMQAAAGRDFKMSVPPPMPGLPQAGWAQGLAVSTEHEALAQALQRAVTELEQDGSLDRIFRAHGVTRLKPL